MSKVVELMKKTMKALNVNPEFTTLFYILSEFPMTRLSEFSL